MGKKKAKEGGTDADFWDGLQGWQKVDVGDALLLGSEEYGFCGLEELDASALGDFVIPGDGPAAAAEADEQQQQPGKGKKRKQAEQAVAEPELAAPGSKKAKGKKQKQAAAAPAGAEGGEPSQQGPADGQQEGEEGGLESVAALKQQLAALAAENKKLKKRDKKEAKAEKRAATAAQRKAEKAARRAAAAAAAAAAAEAAPQPAEVSAAWKELELHPSIERAIAALGFDAPTQVQAECLPAAVRDRRDVIGAAQTGSGKTLAFGLPIMQLLLQERALQAQQGGEVGGEAGSSGQAAAGERPKEGSPLRALILAPTRELAMQVCEHLQAVGKGCGVWVVPIVGGISALKQERLLSKRPEVIVATPGRLWDLMREGQAHVTDLSRLSFLVIDEADRMVQQGHYGELSSILGAIPSHQQVAQPEAPELEDEPQDEEEEEGQEGEEADGAGGEEGEDDEEAADEEAAADEAGGSSEEEGAEEEAEEEEADEGQQEQQPPAAAQQRQQARRKQQPQPQRMQTFVFSATLTLPANLRKRLRKGGGGASGSSDLESLMDRIPFRGKPKIVDLTSQRKLADKVEEAYVACGEAERDEALYCLLAKHPGRTIVFVNAIASVRRLAAILKLLGLPVQALHAGMQQRQRLRALDKFRAESNAVLVATDVAARGLDIKDVRCVVHYQLPASVDVYVHRSGRTARAEAEGLSVALVTPKENARFLALLKAMRREEPPQFPLDVSLLPAVHRRVRLAIRLDEVERKQSKGRAEASWRRQNAEAVGIVLSDDDEDAEEVSGRRLGKKAKRDASGKRGPEDAETAAELRAELAALLAEPLQPKFSGKWFAGGQAAAVMAGLDPSSGAAAGGGKGSKKQQRQQAKQQQQRGEAEGEEGAPVAEPRTVQTVQHAVALAQQRSDSRSQAAAQAAAKRGGGRSGGKQQGQGQQQQQGAAAAGPAAAGGGGGKAKVKSKGKKQAGGDPRAAAVQAALNKALAAKQRKKAGGGRGMLVIPQALGRQAGGPDALAALRQKLRSAS